MDKLGTVVFEGKLYNLDNMSTSELEKLLNTIETKKANIMSKVEEYIAEMGEFNG